MLRVRRPISPTWAGLAWDLARRQVTNAPGLERASRVRRRSSALFPSPGRPRRSCRCARMRAARGPDGRYRGHVVHGMSLGLLLRRFRARSLSPRPGGRLSAATVPHYVAEGRVRECPGGTTCWARCPTSHATGPGGRRRCRRRRMIVVDRYVCAGFAGRRIASCGSSPRSVHGAD